MINDDMDARPGITLDMRTACAHASNMSKIAPGSRRDVAVYDAMYIALAEARDAPIVTCDAPLGRAPGHRAHIAVIE